MVSHKRVALSFFSPFFCDIVEVTKALDISLQLLQPLRWCCVDCVIRQERDVREE